MTKKRASKAEREYMAKVAELGCVICKAPAHVHHMLAGAGMGQKSSNFDTFGLCPDHHQNGGIGVAIHAGVKTWEEKHGTELYHVVNTRMAIQAGM
jgi:hypothetical protein